MSRIGMVLYGYCSGYFGRDSYQEKRIEAEGYDWLVVRDDRGRTDFASFTNAEEKDRLVAEWSVDREEDSDV